MNKLSVDTESLSSFYDYYKRKIMVQDYIDISKRLEAIVSFIHKDSFFLDIGSDHAYLPCYVCLQHPNVRAIASEVNKSPWLRAKQTVTYYDLKDRIDVRLGNGLEILHKHDKIDTLTIAGMGGSLIKSILTEGTEKLATVKKMITQPNNHAYAVREFLIRNDFQIVEELIMEENGHIYEIIVSEKGTSFGQDTSHDAVQKQMLFGPILLKEKSSIFLKKWQGEYEKTQFVLQQIKQAKSLDHDKIAQLNKRLQWIEEVLS